MKVSNRAKSQLPVSSGIPETSTSKTCRGVRAAPRRAACRRSIELVQCPVGLPLHGGLVPGELREYALLHIEDLFSNGSLGNDDTVADNVMDGGSGRDIFYGGDGDDMLSPAKDSRQRDEPSIAGKART